MLRDSVQEMRAADATIQDIEIVSYQETSMAIYAHTDVGSYTIYDGPLQLSEDILHWLLNVACGNSDA